MAGIKIIHPVTGSSPHMHWNSSVMSAFGRTPSPTGGVNVALLDGGKAVPNIRVIVDLQPVILDANTKFYRWCALFSGLSGKPCQLTVSAPAKKVVVAPATSNFTPVKHTKPKPKRAVGQSIMYPLPSAPPPGDQIGFCPYSFYAVGGIDPTTTDTQLVSATMTGSVSGNAQSPDYLDPGADTGVWVAGFFSLNIATGDVFQFQGFGDQSGKNPSYLITNLAPDSTEC